MWRPAGGAHRADEVAELAAELHAGRPAADDQHAQQPHALLQRAPCMQQGTLIGQVDGMQWTLGAFNYIPCYWSRQGRRSPLGHPATTVPLVGSALVCSPALCTRLADI